MGLPFFYFYLFIFFLRSSIRSRSSQCFLRLANDQFDMLCLSFSPIGRVSFLVSHRDTAVDRNLRSFHLVPTPKPE